MDDEIQEAMIVSVKQIAKMAGTSPATVSRILNNPDYHCSNPNIREKVWKAAMELNYVPNEAARSLKKGTKELGNSVRYIQVLMTRTEKSHADPFFMEVLRVVESEIHKNSCILSQVWYMSVFSNDKQCRLNNVSRLVDELYQETDGKSDGLIVIGRCNKEALRLLKTRFKNLVSVNRNSTNREIDEITCDGTKIATIAVEYLLNRGHNDIGYVGECHGESRYKGYIDTLIRHDMEINPSYIYETKQTEMAGYDVVRKILNGDDIPTAIYCANDVIAIGILKALEKFRKKYFNLSIISSDDIEQAQFTKPMLTTVALPKVEMGRFAVYLLLDRINGKHDSVTTMELEGHLVIRESCVDAQDSFGNYTI